MLRSALQTITLVAGVVWAAGALFAVQDEEDGLYVFTTDAVVYAMSEGADGMLAPPDWIMAEPFPALPESIDSTSDSTGPGYDSTGTGSDTDDPCWISAAALPALVDIEKALDALKGEADKLDDAIKNFGDDIVDGAIDLKDLGLDDIADDIAKNMKSWKDALINKRKWIENLTDQLNEIKKMKLRGGFVSVHALGGMVAVEGAIYLIYLSYDFNQNVMDFANDPDFEYISPEEEALITFDVTSGDFWKGWSDYWFGWAK